MFFLCKNKSDYVTKYFEGTFFEGSGTNKDITHLYIYKYFEDYSGFDIFANVAESISSTDWWLKTNNGKPNKTVPPSYVNKEIYSLLIYSGLMSIH